MNDKEAIGIVFLGGSCNPSSWRKEIAIPYFDARCILYYNPQVEYWTPDLVQQEESVKRDCKCLLFVINDEIRSVASMVEVAYLSAVHKNIVLVMKNSLDFKNELKKKNNEKVDLWKARTIIEEIVEMNGLIWTGDIFKALELCVDIMSKSNMGILAELNHSNNDNFETSDIYIYVSEDLEDWKNKYLLPDLKSKNLKYFDFINKVQNSNKRFRYTVIKKAKMLLYVIGGHSRSPDILVEAAHFCMKNRNIVLSVENIRHPHHCISEAEVSDYNRGRYYLKDMARQKGILTVSDHKEVINAISSKITF